MALRTFRHNPSLGGFGGEASLLENDDENAAVGANAFCQIVKEVMDNAVDACRGGKAAHDDTINKTNPRFTKQSDTNNTNNITTRSFRIRVNLDPVTEDDGTQVMRLTCTDNGSGMSSIPQCVDAFQTSKGHNARNHNDQQQRDANTSGRYGIGLTLCLLHAQRLVPNTRASIKSATALQPNWTVMSCVVDTQADSVRCFPEKSVRKTTPEQSGTSVSLLIPGGTTAVLAWPRLAEYFARFQLSLGLNCHIEVLAPSLSRVPLYVRPIQIGRLPSMTRPAQQQQQQLSTRNTSTPGKGATATWSHPFAQECSGEDEENINIVSPPGTARRRDNTKGSDGPSMESLLYAAQQFLECPVSMENLAHSTVPIRLKGVKAADAPKLEVSLIVHGSPNDDDCDDEEEEENVSAIQGPAPKNAEASMALIRMVNQIPLLDSAEGVACGLVQGIVAKESLWRAAGLEVSLRPNLGSMSRVPTFSVTDSSQVLPFLKSQHGEILDEDSQDDSSTSSCSDDNDDDDIVEAMLEGRKRSRRGAKRRHPRKVFLPADARLGNILLIVQIHATPSQLPLPTLCKGRIPQDHTAINQALEVGLKTCLRQLQASNPALFLTARELRVVERKACFVPLLSNALSSILSRSNALTAQEARETVEGWGENENEDDLGSTAVGSENLQSKVDRLSSILRNRLHTVLDKPKKASRRAQNNSQEGEEVSHHSDETGHEDLLLNLSSVDWVRGKSKQDDDSSLADENSKDSYDDLMM